MKTAVRKLSKRFDEMFAGLNLSKETGYLGSRVMLVDTMLNLHTEKVITDEQLMEAMDEVELIYPSK